MKQWGTAAALVCAGFLALAGCHHKPIQPSGVRTSIVRSNFIFEATVQQVGGSTLPENFRGENETLVVSVTRAFTPEFQEFIGQTATVSVLPDSPVKARTAKVGDKLVFLGNPLFYGETLAVEAEARQPSATLEQQIGQRHQFQLEDRVKLAEVIVEGVVTGVEKAPAGNRVSDFEHDPEWSKATVNITSVIRGGSLRQIDVYFPASRDLVWYTAPKFSPQQSGTWFLHRQSLGERRKEREYVALHPLDFQDGKTTPPTPIRALARENPYSAKKAANAGEEDR